MQQKNIKIFIFPLVALFVFLMLIFGAAYAYLSGIINMNTANYQVTLPAQTSLVCTKTDCNVTITPSMMINTNTSTTAKTSSTCSVNCTCSGTPGALCTYNVYLMDSETVYRPSSSLGANKEFTVTVTNPSGCTAQNSSSTETQVNTLRGKSVSYCSLQVPSTGNTSANVTAEFKWYNLNLNQDDHISKSYKYHLSTESVIPDTYQRVEYLESTGLEYINTGIDMNASQKYDIDIDFAITELTTYGNIISSQSGGSNIYITRLNNNTNQFVWYPASLDSQIVINSVTLNQKYNMYIHYENGNNKLIIDYGTPFTASNNIVTNNVPLIIFASNASGSYKSKARVYQCSIMVNNTLVRNFIPCYRKTDEVRGFYDTVSGNFFPNNSNSGTFDIGSNI